MRGPWMVVLACTAAFPAPVMLPAAPPVAAEIVYVNGSYDELWVMNADGSGKTRLLRKPNSRLNSPCWSPDGAEIAFAATIDRKDGVWAIGSDGTGLRQVVATTTFPWYVSWSPVPTADGSHRIAYLGAQADVVVVHPDGSDVVQLTTGGGFGHLDWSSDGTRLVTQRSGDSAWTLDVGVAAGVPVITGMRSVSSGRWISSPPRWDDDDSRIFLGVDLDLAWVDPSIENGPPTFITNSPTTQEEHLGEPSPDGTRLIYARVVDRKYQLYVLELGTGVETLLASKACKPNWRR